MNHVDRLLLGAAVVAAFAVGCGSNAPKGDQAEGKLGRLGLPLVTNGPSGTRYQLRNAVFDVIPYTYYWYGVGGAAGTGGASPVGTSQPSAIVVSSEDNPSAESIQVDLPEGEYSVRLRSGWSMQSVVNGEAQAVEAVLLNSDTQWVYVYRHSTNWVSFQFGLGNREIWFNGKVNIEMDVYENPDQYYGSTGGATWSSTGGATWSSTGGATWSSTGGATWTSVGGSATAGTAATMTAAGSVTY